MYVRHCTFVKYHYTSVRTEPLAVSSPHPSLRRPSLKEHVFKAELAADLVKCVKQIDVYLSSVSSVILCALCGESP
jgi:hypothetical protein